METLKQTKITLEKEINQVEKHISRLYNALNRAGDKDTKNDIRDRIKDQSNYLKEIKEFKENLENEND